jgi:hypothetical protein
MLRVFALTQKTLHDLMALRATTELATARAMQLCGEFHDKHGGF